MLFRYDKQISAFTLTVNTFYGQYEVYCPLKIIIESDEWSGDSCLP
jgi:hypothetical protein